MALPYALLWPAGHRFTCYPFGYFLANTPARKLAGHRSMAFERDYDGGIYPSRNPNVLFPSSIDSSARADGRFLFLSPVVAAFRC